MDNRKQFLEEYRKVCVKYGLQIGACGCCNSPFVVELDSIEFKEHDTEYGYKEITVYEDGELIDCKK